MSDLVLLAWLFVDFLWTAFLFGGASYLVFYHGHSPWLFLGAAILSTGMGGEHLYPALANRWKKRAQ